MLYCSSYRGCIGMENNAGTYEKAYTTSEIATMLDIAVPTVRKYAQNLEKAGYQFLKTEGKARLFVDHDIMVFRYLVKLRKETNITVEQATSIIVERFGKGAIHDISGGNTPTVNKYEQQSSDIKELKDMIKELTKRLDQQQDYIEKRMSERDNLLLQAIRETQQETQRQIAIAKENKSIWQKLLSNWQKLCNRK